MAAKTTTGTAKRKRTVKPKKITKAELVSSYKEHVLLNGAEPASVYQFMSGVQSDERTFYEYFSSFNALEMQIWYDIASETLEALERDETFNSYNSREKLLAFYFTLFERLRNDRSYVSYSLDKTAKYDVSPAILRKFKELFTDFAERILGEGKETKEIMERPVISERYKDGLWVQMMFLLRFWLRDDSKGFSNTDAAIEKSVNLSFELMGRGPLDQMIDFAKFLYTTR